MDGGGPKPRLFALWSARSREKNTTINQVPSIPGATAQRRWSFQIHHCAETKFECCGCKPAPLAVLRSAMIEGARKAPFLLPCFSKFSCCKAPAGLLLLKPRSTSLHRAFVASHTALRPHRGGWASGPHTSAHAYAHRGARAGGWCALVVTGVVGERTAECPRECR